MKNKIILAVTILVTFLLQCTIAQYFSIGSIVPNLLIILCVSMGLLRGQRCGMMTGFFAGILCDIFYASFWGFSALIYMYVGYLCGAFCNVCYDDDIKVPVLLTAVFDVLYNFAFYALQFLLRGRMGLKLYAKRIILPEMLFTMVVCILFYPVYFYINRKFLKQIKKESESIWVLK